MSGEVAISLTLEQRKLILQLMNYSYTIPPEFHECVADAIKKYATKSYSEETIAKMVQKSQSVANSGFLLREDSMSLFRGKFAEWLACIEYNSLKNSGSVIMTIVNPDETSKADLLHFIKVGDEFKAVAGPDIKSGGSTYVFNQWKKIVTSRHDIPMVDFDGVLTTESGLKQLTKSQREEFEMLCEKYPRKRPIPTKWTSQDELRLRVDYFKGILETEDTFKYSPEVASLLKETLKNQCNEKLIESDWSEFNDKCKEIFADVDFNVGNASLKENDSQSNIKDSKLNDKTKIYRSVKIDRPKKVMVKFNDFNVGTLLKGVGTVATLAGGAVFVYKNPGLIKNILHKTTIFNKGIINKLTKGLSKGTAAREVAKGTVKIAVKGTAKAAAKGTATVAAKVTATETAKAVAIETVAETVNNIRSSPVRHEVNGYFRKSGTFVKSYMRGKNIK